jgi:hypothetical protein
LLVVEGEKAIPVLIDLLASEDFDHLDTCGLTVSKDSGPRPRPRYLI